MILTGIIGHCGVGTTYRVRDQKLTRDIRYMRFPRLISNLTSVIWILCQFTLVFVAFMMTAQIITLVLSGANVHLAKGTGEAENLVAGWENIAQV